jgi:hypothetical protein
MSTNARPLSLLATIEPESFDGSRLLEDGRAGRDEPVEVAEDPVPRQECVGRVRGVSDEGSDHVFVVVDAITDSGDERPP